MHSVGFNIPPLPAGIAALASPSHQPFSTDESLSQLVLRSGGGQAGGKSEIQAPALIYHIKMSAGRAAPA